MTLATVLLLLLAVIASVGWSVAGRLARRRARELLDSQEQKQQLQTEREAIELEERRLFRFIHELGVANSCGARDTSLHPFIVEGVIAVTNSKGGALYIFDEASQALVPRYYSEHCAPLLALGPQALAQAATNPLALLSSLRLQTVAVGEGIIGHVFAAQRAESCSDLLDHRELHSEENALQRGVSLLIGPVTSGDRRLGVLALTVPTAQRAFSANDFDVFKSLIEQAAFSLGHAVTHQELQSKRQLEAELKNAADVQRILLPEAEPEIDGFVVAGKNRPARVLSGDFYDYVQPQPGGFGAVIADVSGKGLSAALVAATCRSALQAHAVQSMSPATVLSQVNRQVYEDIREDMFISMIYLIADATGSSITLARAGHPEPFLWRAATGKVETLRSGGLGVGIDKGDVFERVTKDLCVPMASGDCLLLYTDGVNEAEAASGEEFGEDRIKEILAKMAPQGAAAIIQTLMAEVAAFTGSDVSGDDITLIALQKR